MTHMLKKKWGEKNIFLSIQLTATRGVTGYNGKIDRILIHSLFESLSWMYCRPRRSRRKLNKPNGSDRYNGRLNPVKRKGIRFFCQRCVHYLAIFCRMIVQSTGNAWLATVMDICPFLSTIPDFDRTH